MHYSKLTSLLAAFAISIASYAQTTPAPAKVEAWKKELLKTLDGKQKTAQEMVDMVFSFSELGFQETESAAYLTSILQKNGFTIEKGIGGIPTAWMA